MTLFPATERFHITRPEHSLNLQPIDTANVVLLPDCNLSNCVTGQEIKVSILTYQ